MVLDIHHEYEVLSAFFARCAASVTTELADFSSRDSASGESSEEDIYAHFHHPNGPGSVENLLCRMTINELNALIEAALQDVLVRVSGEFIFDRRASPEKKDVKFVHAFNRAELERELTDRGVTTRMLKGANEAQQIREISEGYKHREGMRPMPKWNRQTKTLEKTHSLILMEGDPEYTFYSSYELNFQKLHAYLCSAGEFIRELQAINTGREK